MILNKTFFLKRYLFTTNEDHRNIYEYELVRYQSAVAYDGLTLSFTEYFALPLYMREVLLESQKKIASNKSERMNRVTAGIK